MKFSSPSPFFLCALLGLAAFVGLLMLVFYFMALVIEA
jgi:hypothetical protein